MLFLLVAVFADPCLSSSGKYYIPVGTNGKPAVYTRYNANFACRGASNSGVAGDTTALNVELGNLLTTCNPPNKSGWVSSWNTDTYGGAPIYLTPAYNAPANSYTIVSAWGPEQTIAVICAKA